MATSPRDFKKSGFFGKKSFGTRHAKPSYTARSERPMEMHQATCENCHKACEVPFKPNGKKPVYCSACYVKPEDGAPIATGRPTSSYRSAPAASAAPDALLLRIDRLIAALEAHTKALTK
jgi:CxxC-x17-CxxC domain-containing protein